MSFIVGILIIVNFIFTCSIMFMFYYLDYKTIVILIVDKLYNFINVSNKLVEEMMPFSAYILIPIIYNTIDANYKITENNSQIVQIKLNC